ncbi:hypothetical protein PCASD_09007 [Puccinia coronata f. sp. avenae]|uniref:Transposase Tc1-like domain-containing protein n=1 Tax=Puccinia coronata f. sp. avenae TaxID=200324 RepID=A0A2N5UKN0_9BASI|nr:hypothetical protein PCASD_09007 [Puccinia coronata f. sp. avenae]
MRRPASFQAGAKTSETHSKAYWANNPTGCRAAARSQEATTPSNTSSAPIATPRQPQTVIDKRIEIHIQRQLVFFGMARTVNKRNRLNTEKKAIIVGMMQAGSTATCVSKKLKLPRQTVSGVFSRYKEQGTVEATHRCGRPRKLDDHSLQQLNSHELGFHNRVAVEKPFVNSKQIEKQLKFASEHLSWTIDDWKKVVWSDESLFEVGKLSKQTKVWKKKGEKYNPECLQPTFKSGCTSTMVWGAFFTTNICNFT